MQKRKLTLKAIRNFFINIPSRILRWANNPTSEDGKLLKEFNRRFK
jgi:hypothetical protein